MSNILNKTIKMSNGNEIPQFGLGTFKLVNKEQVYECVLTALKQGYRHIDTAAIYFNQKTIAKAIKDSGVKREDIFITSKVWNWDHKYKKAVKAIDQILDDLALDYLDLLLVHFPTRKRLQCWKALEAAVEAKKVKSIGISNFSSKQIEELIVNCNIKPVIHQFELNPALLKKDVIATSLKYEMVIESWGTLINGDCFKEPILLDMGKKYNKSAAQICLKWAIQKNYVVIPKSSKPSRVIQNTQIDDFTLTAEDIELIESIPQKKDRWIFSKWIWVN